MQALNSFMQADEDASGRLADSETNTGIHNFVSRIVPPERQLAFYDSASDLALLAFDQKSEQDGQGDLDEYIQLRNLL
jgi:hypothetical protein